MEAASFERDPTRRFSDRVADYVRSRPTYPREVLAILASDTGLAPGMVVADVGAGTGISTRLFLDYGCEVYAVEPNAEMRAAAETTLSGRPGFHSVPATAEATTLPPGSMNYVAAGQAFHWFDAPAAHREFTRILGPGGWVVLLWNSRRPGTAFLEGYEALLQQFGTDYRDVDHKRIARLDLEAFFEPGVQYHSLPHAQIFDREGLRGRLLSSSYAPAAGHPHHAPMLERLDSLFAEHARDGRVVFEYDTELYFGRLRPG